MESAIQKVLISEEQIKTRIQEMAAELNKEYAGKDPVIVGVLKGVVVFYADMVRALDFHCQMDFMCISSYSGTSTTGQIKFIKDLNVDIRGRHVLLLEDIVDSGLTLSKVVALLKERGPASVKVCTLLDKPAGRKVEFQPDFVGFTIPDAFVVGYGLDYNEYYRNLPYIGVVKKEVYSD